MPITEITRRAIIDELILGDHWWAGRLEEPDFLARIYPINDMESHDRRFDSAYGDVWQHRINNHDWTDDWVFTDDRFQLMDGPDEVLLRFLAETVHPVVRPDRDIAESMVASYNEHLRHDGYELHATGEISGRPVFGARSLMDGPRAIEHLRAVSRDVDAAYISQQITRMESSITSDPDLAIGTAKELVETVARTILDELGIEYSKNDDLPALVKATRKALELVPEDVPESAKASDTIRRLLSNLGTVTDALASLRNAYGTGHGRSAGSGGLQPRHARLAVGSAATLATFCSRPTKTDWPSQRTPMANPKRISRTRAKSHVSETSSVGTPALIHDLRQPVCWCIRRRARQPISPFSKPFCGLCGL